MALCAVSSQPRLHLKILALINAVTSREAIVDKKRITKVDPKAQLHDFPKRGAAPVVFMFQPTKFERVPTERLDEWEELMRRFVGIKPDVFNRGSVAGIATRSVCDGGGDDSGFDDSDVEAGAF
jgi:hypothetical protein